MAGFDFTDEEYAARIRATRDEMGRRGVELLVVTDPSNMAWLTGYDGWSFYVHQCVLLPMDGAALWFGREMDAAGARMTVFMADEAVLGYADEYVQNPAAHPMTYLGEVLAARGFGGARIGLEMDNYYFSAAAYQALVAGLPGAGWVDATGLVNWRRAVKSAAELVYMRRAARIVEGMHRRAFEVIELGLPKNRLVAEIYRSAIAGADGHGGDYPAIVPLAPSGAEAGAPHLTWDDRPLVAGGTFLELAGVYRRYHCPLSRTIHLGAPPVHFRRAEAAIQRALADALAVAKPGARCCEVAAAMHDALRDGGFAKDGRCGYAVGLSYPPDWGERTMSLRADDDTALVAGMTFHFMPGLWRDGWGIEITESVVITDDGCEPLADYPRELLVK